MGIAVTLNHPGRFRHFTPPARYLDDFWASYATYHLFNYFTENSTNKMNVFSRSRRLMSEVAADS
jgi:hypothetical protein